MPNRWEIGIGAFFALGAMSRYYPDGTIAGIIALSWFAAIFAAILWENLP